MSLLKHYLTLLDIVRKTVNGTFSKRDFQNAYDSFIEISLYARKYGKDSSAVKEIYDTNAHDKEMAENLYKTAKSAPVKKEIECLGFTTELLNNATKGELLISGLTDVLCEATRQHEHYGNFEKIDVWSYECEGY